MEQGIVSLASQFGAPGLIILYLIWERLTVHKERLQLDKDRIEVDKSLAASLAALTVVVQGKRDV